MYTNHAATLHLCTAQLPAPSTGVLVMTRSSAGGHHHPWYRPGLGRTLALGQTTLGIASSGAISVEPLSEESSWGAALGRSPAMRRLFAVLPRIAASDVPVLLEGETGTGKTMLAEAIHRHGDRMGGPFVVVDCGAIAPGLIESELFGHQKGAFTGAHAQRAGAFELASGGTVFLDEL